LTPAARLAKLLRRDHSAANQALSQPVDRLVRGREHDFAAVQVDRLRVILVFEEQEAGLGRRVHQLEHVHQGERADVRDQHQVAVPGEGHGGTAPLALEQDRARARSQQPDRLVLLEAEPGTLLR
jgi:hypothetical protein